MGWQTKNKPHLLGDRIIVPLHSERPRLLIFAYTDDQGAHWKASNPAGQHRGQPTILKKEDGTLVAYLREHRSGFVPDAVHHSSTDSAARWSIPAPPPVYLGAGFDGVTLRTVMGRWCTMILRKAVIPGAAPFQR